MLTIYSNGCAHEWKRLGRLKLGKVRWEDPGSVKRFLWMISDAGLVQPNAVVPRPERFTSKRSPTLSEHYGP